MSTETYMWEEGKSCPLGYPIEVFMGGFSAPDGDFVSLYSGITTGKRGWGSGGNGMDHRKKSIPNHIHVQWLSFVENQMYEIDTDIDQQKMLALFKKGFQRRGADGVMRQDEYESIVAGFAPGGVVVVWVSGAGRQVEVGRYPGRKIVIPQSQIDGLDPTNRRLFDPAYRNQMLSQNNVIPKEVREANKNKPIPFGLWDTYRTRYSWKPTFEIQNEGKMGDFRLQYLNGEVDRCFYENIIPSTLNKQVFYEKTMDALPQKLPIPSTLSFGWKTKDGIKYVGNCTFDEASALEAFKEVYGENPGNIEATLDIRVNMANTYFTVKLKGNGTEVFIKTEELETFKELYQ